MNTKTNSTRVRVNQLQVGDKVMILGEVHTIKRVDWAGRFTVLRFVEDPGLPYRIGHTSKIDKIA